MADVSVHVIGVGADGSIELPREVCERHGWESGTLLIATASDQGMYIESFAESAAPLT